MLLLYKINACGTIVILIGKEKPTPADLGCFVTPYWAPRWRQLGAELKVKESQMDIIEKNHPTNCSRCCDEMFSEWLGTNYTATWDNVLKATAKLFHVPGKHLQSVKILLHYLMYQDTQWCFCDP